MNESDSFLFIQKKRRQVISLNVTALIDVCSLLIIFLVMDTVFGVSGVDVPKDIFLPKSVSRENLDVTLAVQVNNETVHFANTDETFHISSFSEGSAERSAIVENLKSKIAKIPNVSKQGGVLMNLVADRNVPYQNIYNIVSTLRAAGVDSVLFIAEGNK